MHYRRLTLLTAASLLWLSMNGQTLQGRITDASGMPLSGASVYITELRQGTTSNNEGYYMVPLPSGNYTVSYQFLGYSPETRKVSISNSGVIADVSLIEQFYEIPAVRVSATGKDPAEFIMRKAIGMAPFHLNQVRSYKAEVYMKGGGKIEKLPRMIQRQMKVEANEIQIKEGEYYVAESVNIISFTAPDSYVNHVISSRSNLPVPESETSPMDYLEASFYQPVLAEMAISPLAPNAFSHYDFRFMGSTSQGYYVIDKIEVTPKRKSQQLFTGVIYIVEDQWAIHSLDLTNENMAGKIRIRQLYTPVEEEIWMPVSHEFGMDISILGIKARASYTSAVKYLEVEPDRSITPPSTFYVATARPGAELPKTETEREIEAILSKDELTPRDMSRLARLNEKNVAKTEEKGSLEIKDRTTYIVGKDSVPRDSAYWERVRPIPLTAEEIKSLGTISADTGTLATRDSSSLTINLGPGQDNKKEKSAVLKAARDILAGRRWQLSEESSLNYDGLIHLRNFSFNTVDGFILGTGLNYSARTGENGRFTLSPAARYAFSRERLLWSVSANILYNPLSRSSFFIRAGSSSDEFSRSGVNPLVNTVSSLFFTENWMKLYNSFCLIAGHRGELANGLTLSLQAEYEQRDPLENTTTYTFFSSEKEYTPNIPDNPFVSGDVEGYSPLISFSHTNLSFSAQLTWTPRQPYRIRNGNKIYEDSDYPTFNLIWKHGYNYNDTISGHFDMIRAEINRSDRFGPFNEFSWRIIGGGFVNRENVQLQDMHFFNAQESPVLINNYEDAFYLKPYYSISSPSFFAEAHLRYYSSILVLKRLPWLSNTLTREKISLSGLWTPDYGFYYEAGYALSEIFFMAELGVYTGFRDLSWDGIGLRLTLKID
jgi:hypothetical protein